MKGKKVITKKDIELFNVFRQNHKGEELSRTEIKNLLHSELGYVNHDSLLKALTTGVNPPIVKIRRGVYSVNKEVVYIQRLQTAFDDYTKCANPRCYTTGKHMRTISIEDAIKVLKDAGYKVLKPITQYKEV